MTFYLTKDSIISSIQSESFIMKKENIVKKSDMVSESFNTKCLYRKTRHAIEIRRKLWRFSQRTRFGGKESDEILKNQEVTQRVQTIQQKLLGVKNGKKTKNDVLIIHLFSNLIFYSSPIFLFFFMTIPL
uniref:Transmembrane protein n=1 Tax=Caenorhabditis tropicalis TaxID=1561998 RepID=A0A1I7V080_9PELO